MEITPATAPAKRSRATRAKKPVSAAAQPETVVQSAKPKAKRKAKPPEIISAPGDLTEMIATAAYYLAAARNFMPGHEIDDWLAAERQIKAMYVPPEAA